MHEAVSFAVIFVLVYLAHRLVWNFGERSIEIDGLFDGEKLIAATQGVLKIEKQSAYGAFALTDMRIVWAPFDRRFALGRRTASAINPDAIAITLGQIRHSGTSWNPWEAKLRLDTPEGSFILTSTYGSFGLWLHYISENARNLLRSEEPATLVQRRARFTEHAVAGARYGTIAGSLTLGGVVLADLLRGGVGFGSGIITLILVVVALGSIFAALFMITRYHGSP